MDLKQPSYLSRLALFPSTTSLNGEPQSGELTIAGLPLSDLAFEYGTPLYIYDRATMDSAVQEYRSALEEGYPGPSGITFAGKSYLCIAVAQWAQESGLLLDCTGQGELVIAQHAGVAPQHILMHGVSKSLADLRSASTQVGVIVVDSLSELDRLVDLLHPASASAPDIWLRLRPGLAGGSHSYLQTGQEESKFGMGPAEFEHAVELSLSENLPLKGLHFHLGSHLNDPAPLGQAIETALDIISGLYELTGWSPEVFCPGGGWGVPYHEADLPHMSIGTYVAQVASWLENGCRRRNLPLPRLQLEPGRSLIAQAGVALYRVEAIKNTPHRRWLLLDGGMADNPRPALYQARYTALPVKGPGRLEAGPAWLAGPYCESGDILIENLPLPELEAGELVAVPVSGAYQLSLSSNYNGARKPAVVWLDAGRASLIQRRETRRDLIRRDLPLPGRRSSIENDTVSEIDR